MVEHDDPATVLRCGLDRLNEHDLDGWYALCADDLVYTGTTTRHGVAEARAVDAPLFASIPDHWRRIDRLLASGDTVAAWLTFGATSPVTHRPFEVELCDIVVVRHGRIRSLTMYAHWDELYAQLVPGP